MSLAVTGKLVKALDVESGTSKAGKEWKKQSFVIDTGAQFNPEVCFSLFGEDKIGMLQGINPGEEIEVSSIFLLENTTVGITITLMLGALTKQQQLLFLLKQMPLLFQQNRTWRKMTYPSNNAV